MVWVIDSTADRGDEMKDMVLENLSCSGSAASPESSFSCVNCKLSSCVLMATQFLCLAVWAFGSLGKGVFQIPKQEYLATFAVEDAYILSEAKEETVRTIVEFVKAPDLFQVH
ncbi:eukaryotic translation initiation factor 3 subunit M-like [Prunus yedoensis var. nudiflora]|uniref:Eukaryotic translation initiation factor 3 subunit M-like n=1 Tax=Prunus yedoensis var. nudiflora TaxID=2094558 RepID=A0A315B598_PRUYE|nr:eukaryotic translation initiation factor 3 subunit M-like [Prunus yedoensis var. nudiflora]